MIDRAQALQRLASSSGSSGEHIPTRETVRQNERERKTQVPVDSSAFQSVSDINTPSPCQSSSAQAPVTVEDGRNSSGVTLNRIDNGTSYRIDNGVPNVDSRFENNISYAHLENKYFDFPQSDFKDTLSQNIDFSLRNISNFQNLPPRINPVDFTNPEKQRQNTKQLVKRIVDEQFSNLKDNSNGSHQSDTHIHGTCSTDDETKSLTDKILAQSRSTNNLNADKDGE